MLSMNPSGHRSSAVHETISHKFDATDEADSGAEPVAKRIVSNAAVAYVVLWILEGAIRKWVPGFDQLFYVARDGFLILAMAYVNLAYPRRLSANFIFWPLVLALFVLTTVQVIVGDVSMTVAGIGFRAYIAPALLLYVVWRYRPKSLAKRMSFAIMALAPMEAFLSIIQVGLPAASWINKQVGEEQTNFVNFGGIVRATGTFTAPSGLTAYIPLCLAVALAVFLRATGRLRVLSGVAILSALTMAGIGGSRGAILAVGIVLAVFVLQQIALSDWQSVKQLVSLSSVLVATLIGLQILLPEVITSLLTRFQTASASEDSTARLLEQTFGFLWMKFDFLGAGSGANSSAGVGLGSSRQWFETDTQKWVSELGIFGYVAALGRLALGAVLLATVVRGIRRMSTTTLLVLAVWIPAILYGGITQNPTFQGAASIMSVLVFLTWNDRSQASPHLIQPARPVTVPGASLTQVAKKDSVVRAH